MLRIAPTSWKPARLLEVSRAKAKGLDVRARVEAFVRRRAPAPAEIALPGAGGIYDISEGETLAFALRAARAAALAAGEASNSPDLQPPRASTDAVFETLPALEPGDAGLRSFACASFGVAPDRLTLQPAADGGPTKGMTDSEVLLVRADDRVVGVVKRTTWRKELARELWSFSVLPRHQTHEARFPSLVAAAQLPTEAGGRVGVLAMSLAEGTPLDDRLAALARATDVHEREGLLEELELDVAKIGRALASLHRQPLPPGDATPVLNHHLELERQVLEQYGGMTALFERSGFRLEPYQARLATLAAAARSNPGQPSLGHGDVHPATSSSPTDRAPRSSTTAPRSSPSTPRGAPAACRRSTSRTSSPSST
ncbi:MAG: hypothetical protein IPJ65_43360 [Archangiaceae bacterium]|nr:hypothetical protein [Archangiaceae bacterium]